MNNKAILLVEDNPDDEALTLRALKKNNISNEVVVAHDGIEALDFLYGNGHALPAIVLLDLKIPTVDST
jgi:two-component system response regulator